MRYGIGESLADFGFNFLEKLHEPIFLVNRFGKLIKSNEAGRKFMRVAHLTASELEGFISSQVLALFNGSKESRRRVRIGPEGKQHQLIARNFADSDYVLIEVVK